MSKLTLNVSKEEFENRVVTALEGAMKSPLKKQRTQVLNAAMVQILHGGNGAGQNEHNLDQFWSEGSTSSADASYMWVGTENYRHESSYEDDSSTVTGKSKEEVSRKLYTNVLTDLADTVAISLDAEKLVDVIDSMGSSYAANYLAEADKTVSELGEEDIAELLSYASNAELETQEAIFNLVTDMMCIEGSHSITEVECNPSQPEQAPVEQKRSVTIHTIIKKDRIETPDSGFDDVSIHTTLNAKEHDDLLIGSFRQYSEDSASFGKDDLLEHRVTQDVMGDEGLEAEDFNDKDYDQIIDWLCEHGRPNLLVEMIPDMTYGLIEIEVEYKEETI